MRVSHYYYASRFKQRNLPDLAPLFKGTISYTAPEILLGREPRKECDIYSLGIMLWQMVTKRIPYEDIRTYEVIVYKVNFILIFT